MFCMGNPNVLTQYSRKARPSFVASGTLSTISQSSFEIITATVFSFFSPVTGAAFTPQLVSIPSISATSSSSQSCFLDLLRLLPESSLLSMSEVAFSSIFMRQTCPESPAFLGIVMSQQAQLGERKVSVTGNSSLGILNWQGRAEITSLRPSKPMVISAFSFSVPVRRIVSILAPKAERQKDEIIIEIARKRLERRIIAA